MIKHNDKWGVIMVDTFSSNSSIPEHMVSVETLSLINNRLKENGIVILNIIQDKNFKLDFSKNIYRTIMTAFDFCFVDNIDKKEAKKIGNNETENNKNSIVNVIYTCRKKSKEAIVYSDNNNRASFDIVKLLNFNK
jgi:hypothetical protein